MFHDHWFNKKVLGWVSITTACGDFTACMTLNDPVVDYCFVLFFSRVPKLPAVFTVASNADED